MTGAPLIDLVFATSLSDAQVASRIYPAPGPEDPAPKHRVVHDPAELLVQAGNAGLIVVIHEAVPTSGTVAWWQSVRVLYPALPMVLITARNLETVRRAATVGFSDILWVRDSPAQIHQAIENARSAGLRRQLAATLPTLPGLPPDLGVAMAKLLFDATPPTSVAMMAKRLGWHRASLHRRLAQHPAALAPTDLVAWVVLAHATSTRQQDETWAQVGARYHLHVRRLRRYAKRLTGLPLAEYARRSPADQARLLVRALLPPTQRPARVTPVPGSRHSRNADESVA